MLGVRSAYKDEIARLKGEVEREQKDHQLTIDTFRQQERIWQQKNEEVAAEARVDAIGEAKKDAAQSCLWFAEMIESQNDISGQTENWSDFHRGQAYAARQLADALRAATLEQLKEKGRKHGEV